MMLDQSTTDMAELEMRWPPLPLRQYSGFWMPETLLPTFAAVHARFVTRPTDVFLDSCPMSGSTWLKAVAFVVLHRSACPPSDGSHPLLHSNPHSCVKFFQLTFTLPDDTVEALPSPRLLGTHLPYSLLQERVTVEGPGCRVVYLCREPKDVLVSW